MCLYEILLPFIVFDHNFGHSKLENVFKSSAPHKSNTLYQSSYKSKKSLRHDCNIFVNATLNTHHFGFDFLLFLFKWVKF